MSGDDNTAAIAICAPQPHWDVVAQRLNTFGNTDVVRVHHPAELETLADGKTDRLFFFPHWSWIVPEKIFTKYECIMFHMTDLPFGRGGTPLQNLISSGFQETQLSAFRCEKGIDSGPIYMKRPLSLAGSAQEIIERASSIIEQMIMELIGSSRKTLPQEGTSTYFKRRTPDESEVNWEDSLVSIFDHIRMLDDDYYPRAFIEAGNFRLTFSNARKEGDEVSAKVIISRKKNHNEG